MMKKIALVAFLMLSQMNFAQNKTVSLGDFDEVKVFDRISLQLVQGSENKIEISGAKKEDVEIVNKNGELKVRMKFGKLLKGDDITATLYFKNEIHLIEASEGSYVSSEATFKAVAFDASSKEGAEVKIKLDVQKLDSKTSSGGILSLSGSATNQVAVSNSGGIIRAKDLKTSQTQVTVNAGGEAEINASDFVEAKTRAGGNIHVYGNPKQVNKKNVIGGNITIQ